MDHNKSVVFFTDANEIDLPIGARVMFLYWDGSGGQLACLTQDGWVHEEGDIYVPSEAVHQYIRLPDDFKFWCELKTGGELLPMVK